MSLGIASAMHARAAPLPPATAVFHVLLVRHAESYNNVLAENLNKRFGVSPYAAHAPLGLLQQYDRARKIDPDLSMLGVRQANLLIDHPHLMDVRWFDLALAHRLRVLTSPMYRTIQTSLPLIKEWNRLMSDTLGTLGSPAQNDRRAQVDSIQYLISVSNEAMKLDDSALVQSTDPLSLPGRLACRATIHPDFCERGGVYSTKLTDDGQHVNTRQLGKSRQQLEHDYGNSHDPTVYCREAGWWNLDRSGEEEEDEYEARVGRALQWTLLQAKQYAVRRTHSAANPDHLLVVSHADFIDTFLTRILSVANNGRPNHCFYMGNTSCSHVEITYSPLNENGTTADSNGSNPPLSLRDFEIRIRCTNSLPRRVPASTPPPDTEQHSPHSHQTAETPHQHR